MDVTFREADIHSVVDADAVLELLDHYSADPMGQGRELPPEVRGSVIEGLRGQSGTLAFLAFADGQPIALAICFRSFSTFNALPLVNIHDLVVRRGFRGQGIGSRLLEFVSDYARDAGCCRVTLEVRSDNATAKSTYRGQGFGSNDPSYEFWVKPLYPEN